LSKDLNLEVSALQGYYTASSGNSLPTLRNNLSVISLKVKESLEDGTDRLFRNFGNDLLLQAVKYPKTAHITSTTQRKLETVFKSYLLRVLAFL
jgi:hypothetical protein